MEAVCSIIRMSLSMLRKDGQEIDDDDVTLPWYNKMANLVIPTNVGYCSNEGFR